MLRLERIHIYSSFLPSNDNKYYYSSFHRADLVGEILEKEGIRE